MDDLEHRLHDALRGAREEPPPGLMAAIMRRHRRHQLCVGASLLAVVAVLAVAVPRIVGAFGGAPSHHEQGPATGVHVRHASGAVAAAPGTDRAAGADAGQIGWHWRRAWPAGAQTGAGPLWFLDGGHSTQPVGWIGREPLTLYVAIAVLTDQVKPGSVVVIKVAAAGRPYLRFLYGSSDSLNPGTTYSLTSGEAGVTFEAYAPVQGTTNYYGGYLVRGRRCVPVDAWIPGRHQPILFHLGACARH